jgi:hypothetical protein
MWSHKTWDTSQYPSYSMHWRWPHLSSSDFESKPATVGQ